MDKGRESKPDFSPARGRRVLIALSGGADSVALAVMLSDAREEYGLTLFAAHVDHGIRPESAEDAAFCKALCARLDIPFMTVRLDVPEEARRQRRGLEAVARELRYRALRQFKDETRSNFIALAHHMDDQAETVLMHLARGAGPRGISGMRALSGDLYRPLLGYRKSELTAYLEARGFGWREDRTNRVADNPRNALRLNAIPALEACYPQFVRAASRYAYSAGIEDELLEGLTGEWLAANRGEGPLCAWLDVAAPPHRAILRRALKSLLPDALSWEQLNAIEALCARGRGRIDVSDALFVERAGCRLYVVRKDRPPTDPAPLSSNGKTDFGPFCVIDAAPSPPIPVRDDPFAQVLNARALDGAVVRTRRDGDRIRPLGCGDKLLSDYFIDRKVDRPLRDGVPLVAVGNRVHWVVGYGISQEAAVRPNDAAIRLECKKTQIH